MGHQGASLGGVDEHVSAVAGGCQVDSKQPYGSGGCLDSVIGGGKCGSFESTAAGQAFSGTG